MSDELYWVPFKIQEEGCSFVACGPYKTRDEAMSARESMKRKSLLNEYVGIPFLARTKKEAEERAHLF